MENLSNEELALCISALVIVFSSAYTHLSNMALLSNMHNETVLLLNEKL